MAGLSVNVPPDEDQQQQDNGLSLGSLDNENEAAAEPDDYERAKAGLNSPKGDPQLTVDGDEIDGGATPNTLRNQYGVNSPRKKGEIPGGWAAANEDGSKTNDDGVPAGLQGLVTQVSRDDAVMPSGSGSDESLNTQDNLKQTTQQRSGFCACLCNIFGCCSPSPQAAASTQMTQQKPPNTIQQASTSSVGKSKPNDPLIPTSEKKAENNGASGKGDDKEEDEKEESYTETEYITPALLPPLLPEHVGKKCLVLDLDETLVHSSFKPIPNPDFIIPVEIDNVVHRVYVMKRPFVDEFLVETAKDYEIVIFTASLAKYADPLLDKLDTHKTITHRLFRESCVLHGTAYVKDLRTLGRKLKDSIIVDNSPPSYLFQPINAIPILSWFDDQTDTQLRDILPCMRTTLKNIKDVRKILDANTKSYRWLCQQANQPLEKYE